VADQTELNRLIARTALGDREAFKRLYDCTAPQILGLLMGMLRQKELAEDMLQDTYLKVWHRAGDYHADRGQVTTWLASIARYRALDLIRSRQVRHRHAERPDPSDTDDPPSPLMMAQCQLEEGRLHDCIEALNNDQRQSIGLAFYRGFTHEELAAQLAVPLGTAKAWIRRGLQQLRQCLEA